MVSAIAVSLSSFGFTRDGATLRPLRWDRHEASYYLQRLVLLILGHDYHSSVMHCQGDAIDLIDLHHLVPDHDARECLNDVLHHGAAPN